MIVIATVLLSHLLGARDLGRLLYFLATSTTGSILIAQGSSTAMLSIMGRMLPHRRRAAARALLLVFGFAIAIVVLISIALIAGGFSLAPDLAVLGGRPIYALLAASVALQGLTVLALGVLAGLKAYRTQSILSIGGSVLQYGVLVAGAALGRVELALTMFVAAMALALLAMTVMAIRFAARERVVFDARAFAFTRRKSFNRGILGFALLTTIGAILFEPVNWLCVSMLLAKPGGATQVAAFLAANQWFAIILFIPINLTQVTLPMVSRAFRETGRLFGPAAHRMLAISLGASICLGTVLLGAMPLLLRLYSPAIAAAYPVFAIIAVNGMIVAIQVATGQMLVAAGRVRANLLFNLGWAVSYLTLTVTIVHNAVDLAGSRLVAYVLHAIGTLVYLLIADRRARSLPAAAPARSASST